MKYTVLVNEDVVTLIESVQEMINEGWEPQGGVSHAVVEVTINSHRVFTRRFAQAMVKREADTEEPKA